MQKFGSKTSKFGILSQISVFRIEFFIKFDSKNESIQNKIKSATHDSSKSVILNHNREFES